MSDRVLRSSVALAPYARSVNDDLVYWARETPERPFVLERRHETWDALTFGAALASVRRAGAALLNLGFSAQRPLAILAENSIDHAIVALAAMHVGVPVCQLSAGYARPDGDLDRLQSLLAVLNAGAIFAPDERVALRLAQCSPALTILRNVPEHAGSFVAADTAFAAVSSDTVAKILFTSGSTGTPKGVITTQRMMCANQAMLAQAWPYVRNEPVVLDWMPWSHVASGSKVFNMVLRHGGSLYIDSGRPMAGAFERTLANLREIAPTLYFNVPRGYALLADALAAEPDLARLFFSRLEGLVNAGASLPADVRTKMASIAERAGGRIVPVLSPYGATETAPMACAVWGDPLPDIESIGLPVPGVELKLAAVDDRFEIRVKGPSVTPGYWRNAEASAAAFDDDGFYRTGDAGDFVDPIAPQRGLAFRGRIAENFKLTSSTWVNAGAVRVALIEAAAGAIDDAVIAGQDRDDIGTLIFFNLERAREIVGDRAADRATLRAHSGLRAHFSDVLARHNTKHASSSTRVAVASLLGDEPDRSAGELTDKGTVNQRIALVRRAAAVLALYEGDGTDTIRPCRRAARLGSDDAPELAFEPIEGLIRSERLGKT